MRIEKVLMGVLLLVCLVGGIVQAAPTTEVRVVKIAADGETILNETTVSYPWMEANLPVQGDGVTHYYHQGPVFEEDQEGRWDPNETTNFKDRGAVKGTDVKDLAELVGGMQPGDEVMIHAVDGYHVEFPYENVYEPQPRQGPIVVCWYNGEDSPIGERDGVGYPPDYFAGMRLVFFADTSTNAEGKHVFGNWDMHEVMPEEEIHLFDDLYPSTNGYTVKWIDEVRIYSGGYHGEKGSTVKSLSGAAETTTPAVQSPLPLAPVLLALVLVLLVGVRRNR
ncbi:MAG: argininosuccinate synthase [Methanomicrobiales archaeon]|nr:argininosuccinate synthase [Methanomicrobiales archaeon]MDI6876043.1 argininosuccinate synthase [Methanomicrobiales archaeon]